MCSVAGSVVVPDPFGKVASAVHGRGGYGERSTGLGRQIIPVHDVNALTFGRYACARSRAGAHARSRTRGSLSVNYVYIVNRNECTEGWGSESKIASEQAHRHGRSCQLAPRAPRGIDRCAVASSAESPADRSLLTIRVGGWWRGCVCKCHVINDLAIGHSFKRPFPDAAGSVKPPRERIDRVSSVSPGENECVSIYLIGRSNPPVAPPGASVASACHHTRTEAVFGRTCTGITAARPNGSGCGCGETPGW